MTRTSGTINYKGFNDNSGLWPLLDWKYGKESVDNIFIFFTLIYSLLILWFILCYLAHDIFADNLLRVLNTIFQQLQRYCWFRARSFPWRQHSFLQPTCVTLPLFFSLFSFTSHWNSEEQRSAALADLVRPRRPLTRHQSGRRGGRWRLCRLAALQIRLPNMASGRGTCDFQTHPISIVRIFPLSFRCLGTNFGSLPEVLNVPHPPSTCDSSSIRKFNTGDLSS